MHLDEKKRQQLGIRNDGVAFLSSVMSYVVGVVTRERERLARVFEEKGLPEVAAGIRDSSLDDSVFRWAGPSDGPDLPPQP